MFRQIRKFVAVLMLLWLPLFSGNAIASSISMQMLRGCCDEAAAMQAMSHEMASEHHMMHHDDGPQAAGDDAPPCTSSAICHVACGVYLAVFAASPHQPETGAQAIASVPDSFTSHITVPLLPPPLVAA